MSIWDGLKEGFNDWRKPNYDSNLNKGQRSSESQKAWDDYSKYKHYAGEALERGDITGEQFNNIKGKAGSATVMNHYINKEENPFIHGMANNVANGIYQFEQSWNDDQPWMKAISDYMQQDAGAEDETPLELPWKEIDKYKKINEAEKLAANNADIDTSLYIRESE